MKKYIKPIVVSCDLQPLAILASSFDDVCERIKCNERCKIWHICLDRERNKRCLDKK